MSVCGSAHNCHFYFNSYTPPTHPGKGRGRQVIAVARTADVVLMMLDASKGEIQRTLLEKELEAVGIRLNKKPPNVYFKVCNGGCCYCLQTGNDITSYLC